MSELQLFDALAPHIESALRDSIEDLGVLVPVIVDQHGRVLDGHHRSRIGEEVGVEVPTATIEVEDDEHALRIAHTLNADRRQLSTADRLKAAARLRERGHSYRAIGEALGVDKRTAQRDVERAGGASAPPAEPTEVRGRDGKTYPAARPVVADPQAGRDPATRRPADEIIAEQRAQHAEQRAHREPAPPPAPSATELATAQPAVQDSGYVRAYMGALVKGGEPLLYADTERLGRLLTPEQVESVEHLATSMRRHADEIARARRGLRSIEGGRR